MDADAFLAYVEQVLVPSLTVGDTVIMDKPASPQDDDGRS